nr:MAG TPA: hypothetical protein [Caudoviricetes sp.]
MSRGLRITSSRPCRGKCTVIGSLIGLLTICSPGRRRRRLVSCGRLS